MSNTSAIRATKGRTTGQQRFLVRVIGAALLALVAMFLVPAPSQASVPGSVTSVTWNVRTSWVNYLTNPAWFLGFGQGSVTTTASNGGTSSVAAGSATTSWGGSYTEYAYSYAFGKSTDTGTPRVVTLKGGLDFDQSAHSIDVSLANLRIVDNPSGVEKLRVDGSYDPLVGSPVSLTDVDAFEIAENPSSGTYAVTLTAAGAAIFNGGGNGSYAAGDPFGSIAYS